jgi:hypothetical protein
MKKIFLFFLTFILLSGACFAQYLFPVNNYENKGEIKYGRFDVANEKIFWPLGKKGLLIFDASNVENLQRLKLYKPYEIRSYQKEYGSANSIKVFGDKAYFAHGDLGFEVLDFSDIYDPEILGRYYRHQKIYNFKIFKHYAILALDNMGVEVIDVSDYKDMDLVSRKNYDEVHVNNIAIYKNYLYASCGYYGIKIIPYKSPIEEFKGNIFAENYLTDNEVHKILIHDDHAILANDADGLTIMDLNLPEHPAPTENIKTDGKAMDILIRDDFLYVACTKGVEVYNIRKINNIYKVDQFSGSGRNFQKLEIEDDYLYATYKSGWWFWEKYGMMIFAIE